MEENAYSWENPEYRKTYHHTCSHVMAQAICRLYPGTKLAIGPAIEEGFYYDIDSEHTFSPDDFEAIEKEMRKICKEKLKLERFELPRAEAVALMEKAEQPYKVELINDLPEDAVISFYRQGEFTDLCAGPHLDSTGRIKGNGIKITNVTGAYWRGDSSREMLQRIYATAWANKKDLQEYLTSTVPVSYNGGTTNLSAIRNLAYDPDPAVRKAAYEAELSCYDRIKDAVAFALNSIKLETISDCQLRGYASPLDRTLEKSDMKRETLDAMLGAMEEYMPKFRQYLRAKGKALGHENGLPWYDLFAPMGKSTARYTTEDAKRILVELFSTFDSELADMVARAFDEEWIDFYPRDGKSGGAFCAGVESIGQSRILTNFDGTFGDIVTLAHELGHAFHNQCIRTHRPLNRDYSMPVAETASTFNECVVMAAAIRQAKSHDEELALIESQLQDVTQIICDIYSRYLFESMVLENREKQFMNAETLCGMMLKAQEQSYGDGLDASFRHPYMWVCKSHYYGSTFYNYPYAFGGLFARGLYAQYEREGAAFVPKYKKLLRTTTVATAEDVAKVAGIDLTDKEFWRGALQTVAQQIDLVCGLLEEGKQ